MPDPRDDLLTIEFFLRGDETLVFPLRELLAATADVLQDNGLRTHGSPDMLAIWNHSRGQIAGKN